MKVSKTWSTVTAGAIVTAVAGVLFAVNVSSAATAADPPDPALTKALAPQFAAPQKTTDKLPAFLREGPQSFEGVALESTRAIGTVQGVRYWLATDERGWTCLISLQPGADEFASKTCATADEIWQSGLALQTATKAGSIRAYFLPAGYATQVAGMEQVGQLLVGSAERASGNLTVAPGRSAGAMSASGMQVGTATLHLHPLPAADPIR